MTDLRKQLLTEPIKRYTVRCVAKAGPSRNSSWERWNCAKSSRLDAVLSAAPCIPDCRRVCDSSSKRRGYFTNPEFSEQTRSVLECSLRPDLLPPWRIFPPTLFAELLKACTIFLHL